MTIGTTGLRGKSAKKDGTGCLSGKACSIFTPCSRRHARDMSSCADFKKHCHLMIEVCASVGFLEQHSKMILRTIGDWRAATCSRMTKKSDPTRATLAAGRAQKQDDQRQPAGISISSGRSILVHQRPRGGSLTTQVHILPHDANN